MSLPIETEENTKKGDLPHFNVEQVMEQIRQQISQRRSTVGSLDDKLAKDVANLRACSDVYYADLPGKRRLIGPLLTLVKKMARWALTPSLARQVSYNLANTRALERLMEQCENLARHQQRMYEEMLSTQEEALRRQAEVSSVQSETLEEVQREVEKLRQHQREVAANLSAIGEQLEATTREQHAAARTAAQLQTTTRERVSRAERTVRRVLHALAGGSPDDGPRPAEKSIPLDQLQPALDYFGFEERMRGSEEEIKERQAAYLDYFRGRNNVLDIGCGRGEFLELLREAGIGARGLDLDLDMNLCCREKGLDVVQEDVLKYLGSLPDESLGGVFCAQFIEHLEPSRIVQLVRLCHQKLQPGACLVMETVNPSCLITFAQSFYADLSHRRPIHPQALKFLFETGPFQDVHLKFSSPVDPALRIPELPQGGEQFNAAIQRLNDLIYGFQDYAAIGRKGFDQAPAL